MKAEEHSQYQEEKQHLDETLDHIQEQLDYWQRYNPVLIHKSTVNANAKLRVQQINKIKEAGRQPYFGRVDWHSRESQEPEVFYIGKSELSEIGIYSWADNLAAEVYYEGRSQREVGKRLLKRTFEIKQSKLVTITDEFVDPSLAERLIAEEFTDTLLIRLLRENRGRQLYDIVATIQSQQYNIIQSPKDQLLVVQGVPGSGKTSVALHRVAYLLYHHREDPDFSADRILVLGPNQMFLNYIVNVLPSLGERRIAQKTFDDWLVERLDSAIRYEPQDVSLELLLDPDTSAAEKAMRYRNAQNKGSLQMARLLERYVEVLHEDVLVGKEDFVCNLYSMSTGSLRARRTADDLRKALGVVEHLPFNERKDQVEQRIVDSILRELGQDPSSDSSELRPRVETQFRQYFSDWRALNVSVAYRRLLRTNRLLRQAGEGIFTTWDLELLAQDAPTALKPFRFSDLAALLYLKILLDGTDGISYDHIVIDEAQDITPLHFKVLHAHSQSASMTILGDLLQSIYPHHGIKAWDELEQAVSGAVLFRENIQQSYRSTLEIIEFANAMLRRTSVEEARLADPIARHGVEPVKHAFGTRSDLATGLAGIVQSEHGHGHRSIAIVCKTLAHCSVLAQELEEAGLEDYQLIDDRDVNYRGGTAIIPSYLTKGLEFDTVILSDADSETYALDELDVRLLTVALTRASHSLHICWVGAITPLLDEKVPSVDICPPLDDGLTPRYITVEEFAKQHSNVDSDWCVECLAGSDKLELLRDGKIDETVLDVLVQSFKQSTSSGDEEVFVEPLDDIAQQALEEYAARMEATPDLVSPESLALAQLAYGLLRNTIRRAGLQIPLDRDASFPEQVVRLWTLLSAVRRTGLALSVGPRTTRRRALEAVDRGRREIAERQLSLLIDYGVVEEGSSQQYSWIRVPQEWLQGLLELSLGYTPDAWDQDLLNQVGRLPEPLAWDGLAKVS